jgi:hypothetical protein
VVHQNIGTISAEVTVCPRRTHTYIDTAVGNGYRIPIVDGWESQLKHFAPAKVKKDKKDKKKERR